MNRTDPFTAHGVGGDMAASLVSLRTIAGSRQLELLGPGLADVLRRVGLSESYIAPAAAILRALHALAPEPDPTEARGPCGAGERPIAAYLGWSVTRTHEWLERLESPAACGILTVARPGDPKWPADGGSQGCLREPTWPTIDESARELFQQRHLPMAPAVAERSPQSERSAECAGGVRGGAPIAIPFEGEEEFSSSSPMNGSERSLRGERSAVDGQHRRNRRDRQLTLQFVTARVNGLETRTNRLEADVVRIDAVLRDLATRGPYQQPHNLPADRAAAIAALHSYGVGLDESCVNASRWPATEILAFVNDLADQTVDREKPIEPGFLFKHLTTTAPSTPVPEKALRRAFLAARSKSIRCETGGDRRAVVLYLSSVPDPYAFWTQVAARWTSRKNASPDDAENAFQRGNADVVRLAALLIGKNSTAAESAAPAPTFQEATL